MEPEAEPGRKGPSWRGSCNFSAGLFVRGGNAEYESWQT
jgi:hypothetical protein